MRTVLLPRFWLSSQENKHGYNSDDIEMFKNFAYEKKNQNPHEDIREFQAESYLKDEFEVDVKNSYNVTEIIFKSVADFSFFILKYSQ